MRCPSCRANISPGLASCSECGEPVPALLARDAPGTYPVAQALADEAELMDVIPVGTSDDEADDDSSGDGGISTLIPYRNPKALAAYYLGFFSLIPVVGLIAAPFALVLGIMGVRKARANPEAKGTIHACLGIVFGLASLLCGSAVLGFIFFSKYNALFRQSLR